MLPLLCCTRPGNQRARGADQARAGRIRGPCVKEPSIGHHLSNEKIDDLMPISCNTVSVPYNTLHYCHLCFSVRPVRIVYQSKSKNRAKKGATRGKKSGACLRPSSAAHLASCDRRQGAPQRRPEGLRSRSVSPTWGNFSPRGQWRDGSCWLPSVHPLASRNTWLSAEATDIVEPRAGGRRLGPTCNFSSTATPAFRKRRRRSVELMAGGRKVSRPRLASRLRRPETHSLTTAGRTWPPPPNLAMADPGEELPPGGSSAGFRLGQHSQRW